MSFSITVIINYNFDWHLKSTCLRSELLLLSAGKRAIWSFPFVRFVFLSPAQWHWNILRATTTDIFTVYLPNKCEWFYNLEVANIICYLILYSFYLSYKCTDFMHKVWHHKIGHHIAYFGWSRFCKLHYDWDQIEVVISQFRRFILFITEDSIVHRLFHLSTFFSDVVQLSVKNKKTIETTVDIYYNKSTV